MAKEGGLIMLYKGDENLGNGEYYAEDLNCFYYCEKELDENSLHLLKQAKKYKRKIHFYLEYLDDEHFSLNANGYEGIPFEVLEKWVDEEVVKKFTPLNQALIAEQNEESYKFLSN